MSGGLTWFDREGKRLESIDFGVREVGFSDPSISPDGKRVALALVDPNVGSTDIWLHDLSRGISSPLTFDPEWDEHPIWSPDGKSLVFKSRREGVYNLYEVDSIGAGSEEVLLKSEAHETPTDWSSSGELIMYSVEDGVNSDLWVLPLGDDGKPEPFLETPFSERDGRFSPDERWVAYVSDESGGDEIYVQSFPDPGPRHRISTSGGRHPHWRRDGRELFYRAGDGNLVAVPIETGTTLEVGTPQSLFQINAPGGRNWGDASGGRNWGDASADGQAFLAISSSEAASLTVVLNWEAELER
jgi:Tol biopolymer transport system component